MPRCLFAVLLLCLAVLPPLHADAPRGRPTGERELHRTYTLATLSAHQARRLHGRLATYRVSLTTDDDREGKHDVYGCKGAGAVRTLWLPAGQESQDEMVIRGVLRVIHHKASVTSTGTRFPAFTEYRLTAARQ